MITSLNEILQRAKANKNKTIAIAVAEDIDVIKALKIAVEKNIATPYFIGDKNKILEHANSINFNIKTFNLIDIKNHKESCNYAVKLVKEKKAEILMKGLVKTSVFLKAILDKENGLMKEDLLSHYTLIQSPYYHKLIAISDVAINIQPDIYEKVNIINNAVIASRSIGIDCPKVAVLSAIETVNPKIESSVHAAMLATMQKRNQIKGCIIDGPLAMDNIVSKKAAKLKRIKSDVAGDADIIIAPDLDTGNAVYKTLNFLGGASCAAIVLGAQAPIVLTSRADSDKSKLLSIALASAIE